MRLDKNPEKYIILEVSDQIHLLPQHVDVTKHDLTKDCWCKPEIEQGKKTIYTHGATH